MEVDETIAQLKLALAEKEKQLEVVSSLTSDFSYSVAISKDGELKLEWAFGAYEKITGQKLPKDISNDLLLQFVHPDDSEKFNERRKLLLTGNTVQSEFRIITNKGEVKWLDDVARPEKEPTENRVVRVTGSLREITKRKNAENELIRSEEKFRNIAENVPGLVLKYKLNPDGSDELLYLSKSVEDIYEVPHEQALHNVNLLWECIHKDDLHEFKESIQESAKNLSLWKAEYRILLPDGKIKWLWKKGTPHKEKDGSIVWDTLGIDITDRKNAESALQEREHQLMEAQRIGKTAYFEWNIKTNDLYWSDNLYAILGLEKQSLDFEMVKKIIHPDDFSFWEDSVSKAVNEKKPLVIDLRMIKSTGEAIWIHNDTQLVLDENGEPERLIGTAQDITDRKNAEEALKESESLFRTLSEASPIAIGLYDANGILIYTNPAALNIMGADSMDDLLGYDMFSDPFLTGKNKELLRKGINVSYESQIDFSKYPGDLQQKLNRQGVMYLQVIITPLGKEKVNGFLVQMQDITDRIEAQIAINESRKRLSLITNSVDSIIYMLNIEGDYQYRFEFINDFFFRKSGYKREDFIGKLLNEKMPTNYYEEQKHYYHRAVTTKEPVKWEAKSPYQMDMKYGLVSIVPILDDNKNCSTILGVITNITERKEAEEALKESEERYKLLSELTFEGILIHKYGVVELVNRSFCDLMGYKEEELIGQDVINMIVHPQDIPLINQNIARDFTQPYEARGIKKDGTVFPVEIEAKNFNINDEKKRVAAVRDITLRKQAQKELEESEKQLRALNATKDKLFSIIGHDLRNPFVQMIELSKLIENSLQNDDLEEVAMYSSMVQNLSERGHALLMNLLDWSRNQTGQLELKIEIFDISQTIEETCELMSTAARRKNIVLKYHPQKCRVKADQNMVTTILRNLLGNAIKFSYKNSVVEIKNSQNDTEAMVRVIDQGVGLKEEHQQLLFDLNRNFTIDGTDKEKGSGLGLVLCKEFAEKNNGTLTLESKYGKGSTFSFTLPVANY